MVIDYVSAYGDSKIIIKWSKGRFNLQVFLLRHWCIIVQNLFVSFNQISLTHISIIFNSEADLPSKLAVFCDEGIMHFQSILEGSIVHEGGVYLFLFLSLWLYSPLLGMLVCFLLSMRMYWGHYVLKTNPQFFFCMAHNLLWYVFRLCLYPVWIVVLLLCPSRLDIERTEMDSFCKDHFFFVSYE